QRQDAERGRDGGRDDPPPRGPGREENAHDEARQGTTFEPVRNVPRVARNRKAGPGAHGDSGRNVRVTAWDTGATRPRSTAGRTLEREQQLAGHFFLLVLAGLDHEETVVLDAVVGAHEGRLAAPRRQLEVQ